MSKSKGRKGLNGGKKAQKPSELDLKRYQYDAALDDDDDVRPGLHGHSVFTRILKDGGFGNNLVERDDE